MLDKKMNVDNKSIMEVEALVKKGYSIECSNGNSYVYIKQEKKLV